MAMICAVLMRFLSVHLKAQSKAGISALSPKRQVGVFYIEHGLLSKKSCSL
jgi:hypothetical protein